MDLTVLLYDDEETRAKTGVFGAHNFIHLLLCCFHSHTTSTATPSCLALFAFFVFGVPLLHHVGKFSFVFLSQRIPGWESFALLMTPPPRPGLKGLAVNGNVSPPEKQTADVR